MSPEECVPRSPAWGLYVLRPLGPSLFFSIKAEMPGLATAPSLASTPAPHLDYAHLLSVASA